MATIPISANYPNRDVSQRGVFYQNGFINTRLQAWHLTYSCVSETGVLASGNFYANGNRVSTDGSFTYIPDDNPANIVVTSYDSTSVEFTYDQIDGYDLEISFRFNTGNPISGFPFEDEFHEFTVYPLQIPVTFGREYAYVSGSVVRGTAAITAPTGYQIALGDRAVGGNLSAFFNVGAHDMGGSMGGGEFIEPALSTNDAKSRGQTGDVHYTYLECFYSHPALVDFDNSKSLSLLSASQTPFSIIGFGDEFYGAQFEFKYDTNVTESFQEQQPAPFFRVYDSIGRASFPFHTPVSNLDAPYGTTLISYKNVAAIRLRDYEALGIESGVGTIDNPFLVANEEGELKLNSPASFAPLGSVMGESVPSSNYNRINYSLSHYSDTYTLGDFLGVINATGDTPDEIVGLGLSGEGNYLLSVTATIGKTATGLTGENTDAVATLSAYFQVGASKNPFIIHPAGFILSAEKSVSNTQIKRRMGSLSTKELVGTITNTSPISLERENRTGYLYFLGKQASGSHLYESRNDGETWSEMGQAFDSTFKTHDMEILAPSGFKLAVATKSGNAYAKITYDNGATWGTPDGFSPYAMPSGFKTGTLRQKDGLGKETVIFTDNTTYQIEITETGAVWTAIS